MSASEDAKAQALKRAEAMQASLDQVLDAARDTQALLDKLDHLGHSLFELAKSWDKVSAERAASVRAQEAEIRTIRRQLERLGEYEAAEAESIIKDVERALKAITD
jgi:hypothetical protein